MKFAKITLILTLIGILLLIIITQNPQTITGKIKTIKYNNELTELTLNNTNTSIIIFTNDFIDLKKDDKVLLEGKESIYKNQKQFTVNKIYKI